MAADENVLVVRRSLFDECGAFQGLCFETERYIDALLNPENYFFEPRATAEEDESLKQIIPYYLIRHEGRIWVYVRGKQGGEGRLISKASMGVGGHINDEDLGEGVDVYRQGAERELNEEVQLPSGSRDRIVALLNDDSNPVGRVHLGIVHLLDVSEDSVTSNESALLESGFKTLDELHEMRDMFETWSQVCLDGMEQLLAD